MRRPSQLLFVQLGEDFINYGGEDQQHADPHAEDAGVFIAEVETDGQQDHACQDRNEHGVECRHRNHDDYLVGGDGDESRWLYGREPSCCLSDRLWERFALMPVS